MGLVGPGKDKNPSTTVFKDIESPICAGFSSDWEQLCVLFLSLFSVFQCFLRRAEGVLHSSAVDTHSVQCGI